MIKFEHTEVVGWEHAIRGMRNPLESWEKSDSFYGCHGKVEDYACDNGRCDPEATCTDREYILGPNDLDLMMRLRNAGTDHRKFMRMLVVYVDITAPLYWWKEFDTHKVGTVANSCSTMHRIHKKEFTLEDFSCEHLGVTMPAELNDGRKAIQVLWLNSLIRTIGDLNLARRYYNEETDPKLKKAYWWQMIQLLPSSYNQRRTVMLNYEVLANIYKSRRNHKLDEWSVGFMDWIESLPYSELITGPDISTAPICNEIMQEAERRVIEKTKKLFEMPEEITTNGTPADKALWNLIRELNKEV